MHDVTSRKRFAMVMPFQAIVLGIMLFRGAPGARVWLADCSPMVSRRAATCSSRSRPVRSPRAFVSVSTLTLVGMLASIANTGGLREPALAHGGALPVLGLDESRARGLTLRDASRRSSAASDSWLQALHSPIGELYAPLGHIDGGASGEFVTLALVAGVVSTIACVKIGMGISRAYERIALELDARREELCDESEGRTRALEGIAARLAHEVKNPLAAIKGLSTHMARSSNDPKVKERLTIAAGEAERLQDIVDGFLSFSARPR